MKTINDLKLGDSVWFEGEEYQFSGLLQSERGDYVYLCQNNEPKGARFAKQIKLTKPLPKLEKGQPIWVRFSSSEEWRPAYFDFFGGDNSIYGYKFYNHLNAFTQDDEFSYHWNQWKLPTKSELANAGFSPVRWQFRDEED